MAVLTDGFITDQPDSLEWRTRSTGGHSSGNVSDPSGNAWIRVERSGGPISGAKVSEQGAISPGPAVAFTSPGSLLSGAPAADGNRPWIVWAGASPLSLREALIVWNAPVVLLNQSKIDGGQVISVTGRLMIIDMGDPVEITGGEQRLLSIGPGAVGFYREFSEATDGDPCGVSSALADAQAEFDQLAAEIGEEAALQALGPVDRQSVADEQQSLRQVSGAPGVSITGLDPPEDLTISGACSDCVEIRQDNKGLTGAGGSADSTSLEGTFFCGICNPGAQCGEFKGDAAAFVVNNGLQVPIRCCHPFVLISLHLCPACDECENPPAPAWLAAMEIFGSTEPMQTLPLDKLISIDQPCDIGLKEFPDGYPATLDADTECCEEQTPIKIRGQYGQAVPVTATWSGELPGYSGQAVLYKPECEVYCGETCQSLITPDLEDRMVAEDIIKPQQRTIPVSRFETIALSNTTITYPATVTTQTLNIVTSCLSIPLNIVTDVQTSPFNYLSAALPSGTPIIPTDIVVGQVAAVNDIDSTPVYAFDFLAGTAAYAVRDTELVRIVELTWQDGPPGGVGVLNVGTSGVTTTANDSVTELTIQTGADAVISHPGNDLYGIITAIGSTFLTVCTASGQPPTSIPIVTSVGTVAIGAPPAGRLVTNSTQNLRTFVSSIGLAAPSFVNVITSIGTVSDNSYQLPTAYHTAVSRNMVTDLDVSPVDVIRSIAGAPVVTRVGNQVDSVDRTNGVDVVTSCQRTNAEFFIPDGPLVEQQVLIDDPAGDINVLRWVPEGGCGDINLLAFPTPSTYKIRITSEPDCCDGLPDICLINQETLPWERDCEELVLLHGNYITPMDPGVNAEICPCYDCSPEAPTVEGTSARPADIQAPGALLYPCTTRFQRVNRRFCFDCNGGES